MARVTVEDCLELVGDRFSLVHLASQRVKSLKKGSSALVDCDNREIVTALREIAAGKVQVISTVETENPEKEGAAPTVDVPQQEVSNG